MATNKLSDNPIYYSRHIPALDGLRGLAISLVLLHHTLLFGGMRSNVFFDKLYSKIAYAGWTGVDLFFVLSGFLITGILYDTKSNKHFFRNFYTRRFLRIFPLYYGLLVVLFVIMPQIRSLGTDYNILYNKQIWYWTYLVNIDVAIDGWPKFSSLGHFWSLAIEEQFYLFWPLLVFVFRYRILCFICVFMVLGAVGVRLFIFCSGSSALIAYVLTVARMDSLALGSLIALLARDSTSRAAIYRWAKPILCASAIAIFAFVVWKGNLRSLDPWLITVGYTVISIFFGAILILTIETPSGGFFGKFFSNKMLIFLGHFSYALYVLHPPFMAYLKNNGFLVKVFPTIMESQLPGQIVYAAIATAGSLLISILSWYLWESWFLKLKRMFLYDVEDRHFSSLPGISDGEKSVISIIHCLKG